MEKVNINIDSEYGQLRSAIVHPGLNTPSPTKLLLSMGIRDVCYTLRNSRHHPESGSWDVPTLIEQLSQFRDLLASCGVKLIEPEDVKGAHMQFFTRDTSFAIGETLFVPKDMMIQYRAKEREGLEPLYPAFEDIVELNEGIEGGDIFVHHGKVFVGIGRQTTYAAFDELKSLTVNKGFECFPIESDQSVLHLDCRFNIIDRENAVFRPDGVSSNGRRTLENHFNLTPIEGPDVDLSVNYFMIGPKDVVMDTRNTDLGEKFERMGIQVHYTNYSEIISLWGSFRCTICPLERDSVEL